MTTIGEMLDIVQRPSIRQPKVAADGVALARWFFRVHDRRGRSWTSTEAARHCMVPVGRIHCAFVAARHAGLMRLRAGEHWRWIGGDE